MVVPDNLKSAVSKPHRYGPVINPSYQQMAAYYGTAIVPARSYKAQRFLGAHGAVSNLFNLGRHLISAEHHRNLRAAAFEEWSGVVA